MRKFAAVFLVLVTIFISVGCFERPEPVDMLPSAEKFGEALESGSADAIAACTNSSEVAEQILSKIENYKIFEVLGGTLSVEYLDFDAATGYAPKHGDLRFQISVKNGSSVLYSEEKRAQLTFVVSGKVSKIVFSEDEGAQDFSSQDGVAEAFITALNRRNFNLLEQCFEFPENDPAVKTSFYDYYSAMIRASILSNGTFSFLQRIGDTIEFFHAFEVAGNSLNVKMRENALMDSNEQGYRIVFDSNGRALKDPIFGRSTPEETIRSFLSGLSRADDAAVVQLFDLASASQEDFDFFFQQYLLFRSMFDEKLGLYWQLSMLEASFKNVTETACGADVKFLISNPHNTEESEPLSVNLVKRGGDWYLDAVLFVPDSPVDPDFPVEVNRRTLEDAVKTYFAALTAEDADTVISGVYRTGLSPSQDSKVLNFYQDCCDSFKSGIESYAFVRSRTIFSGENYDEVAVTYIYTDISGLQHHATVYLDFVRISGEYLMLPETNVFDFKDRPDYSNFSPKHAALKYLSSLVLGDPEKVFECYTIDHLTQNQKDEFYRYYADLVGPGTTEYQYTMLSWEYTYIGANIAEMNCLIKFYFTPSYSPPDNVFPWRFEKIDGFWKMLPEIFY